MTNAEMKTHLRVQLERWMDGQIDDRVGPDGEFGESATLKFDVWRAADNHHETGDAQWEVLEEQRRQRSVHT